MLTASFIHLTKHINRFSLKEHDGGKKKDSCSVTWMMLMVFWTLEPPLLYPSNSEMKTGATVERKKGLSGIK